MNRPSFRDRYSAEILLALASVVPTIVLLAAWCADQWLVGDYWLARLGNLTFAVGITGFYGFYSVRRLIREGISAREYLYALAEADLDDVADLHPEAVVQRVRGDSPWNHVFVITRARITNLVDRISQLEMGKAALDVRVRRSVEDHNRISTILDSLSDPVLAVDEYDELVLANPSAAKLFQLDLVGEEKRVLADLIECQTLVNLLAETRRRKTTGKRTRELALQDADGQKRWYSITARSLANVGGDSDSEAGQSGAVAILRDVSTHKEIQKRNAEFVSSVSHEMKTPLAGIRAHVELLADGDADDEQTREVFLDIIMSQTDRLRRLVENLLNIARIEAGVVQVSKVKRSLNELLTEAHDVVQHLADEKRITIVSDLSNMYLGVYVDRDMLLQAAINLLSNAIKYTPEGRQITLRSRMVGSAIEFEVEDEGVGLSDHDRQRVFDKFYRVSKDKTMAAGTGLGLPLAKHIVEDVHQGRLSVISELGVGSTFSVQLPSAGKIT